MLVVDPRELIENAEIKRERDCLTFLIIGAGVAGLTAASELVESGVKLSEITILEARSYVGGRVLSGPETLSGGRLDMGAAWLHGTEDNPVLDLLKENVGEPLIEITKCNPWMHSEKTMMQFIGDSMVASEQERQDISEKWVKVAKILSSSDSSLTISEALKAYAELESLSTNDLNELLIFVALVEVWCGGSARDLSTSFLQAESSCPLGMECGEENVTVPTSPLALFGDYKGPHCLFSEGASSIIEAICNKNGPLTERIRLGKVVTKIISHSDSSHSPRYFEVHMASDEVIYAQNVCVTIPPGPLKRIEFSPPLPASRLSALSKIGMGAYKKVQLEWQREDVFWIPACPCDPLSNHVTLESPADASAPFLLLRNRHCDPSSFYLDKPPTETSALDYVDGPDLSLLGPFLLFDNFMSMRNMPVLEAVCAATQGWNLCGKPDNEIVELVMALIHQHFPNAPYPDAVYITRWEEDIFSDGAYSHHSANITDDEIKEIALPLENGHLVFGGEYTDPHYYGSLNAAFNSGRRIAKELLTA